MDKKIFDPAKISTAAINRNKNIAGRIHWMLTFMQAGRFEDASMLADNLVKGLAEQDATLRTLRDVATNGVVRDVLDEKEDLPFVYVTGHTCSHEGCDNPLRFPLHWNGMDRETNQYVCSYLVDDCGGIASTPSEE